MRKIGVIVNRDKDMDFKYTKLLVECITQNSGEAIIESSIADELCLNSAIRVPNEKTLIDKSEIIVCLGGDGTFLQVARKVFKKDIPMFGINLGSLGFLTEVDRNDISSAIAELLKGNFTTEKRMMLEATISKDGKILKTDHALNDIVISRVALSRILHLNTYINNDFVDSFPGDGLIVSSPTGSTAYSLSAGGPIVEPDVDLIIVTPVCPHILYSRSFITTGERVVKVSVDENYEHHAMVTVDGQEGYEISGGDEIEIKRSSYTVKVIKINRRNFFNVLRTKIYDRGDKIRRSERN